MAIFTFCSFQTAADPDIDAKRPMFDRTVGTGIASILDMFCSHRQSPFALASLGVPADGRAMAPRPSLSTRLRWRRRFRSLGALLLLAAMAAALWLAQPVPAEAVPLVQVIDGDSLSVRREGAVQMIRLSGLDAVEYRQRCIRADGSGWACGQEARVALVGLAGRGPLFCSFAAKDKYGRTLAACRTRAEPDGVDLAAEMVRQGWAVATDDTYLPEAGEAQEARRGIWAGDFDRPADWRAAHARPAAVLADH